MTTLKTSLLSYKKTELESYAKTLGIKRISSLKKAEIAEKVNNDEFMRRIRKFVNRNTCSRPQQPEMTGEDINKYNITDILSR